MIKKISQIFSPIKIILLAMLLFSQDLMAQNFEDKKSELEQLQQSLQKTENARSLTQTKLRHLNRDMDLMQRDLVTKAAEIQKIERSLADHDKRIKELAEEEQIKTMQLEEHKQDASNLVSAAWSLQHRPQLAAWLLPEQNRERALMVRALQMSTFAVKHDIDEINDAMGELDEIRFAMIQTQKDRNSTRQNLKNERIELQNQLVAQQQLQATLQQDDDIYSKKLDSLIQKAETLQGLVASLEQEREQKEQNFANIQPINKPDIVANGVQQPPALSPTKPSNRAVNFASARGTLPLPASGQIAGRFGERRGANDRLKGIEIITGANAIVANPYEGEVLFVGDFLDYGNMVIIRHSKQYHTLIAGLSRINVQRGQFLLDGAPIGAMSGNSGKLYLELRNQSQAIDPAPWYVIEKNNYAKR